MNAVESREYHVPIAGRNDSVYGCLFRRMKEMHRSSIRVALSQIGWEQPPFQRNFLLRAETPPTIGLRPGYGQLLALLL